MPVGDAHRRAGDTNGRLTAQATQFVVLPHAEFHVCIRVASTPIFDYTISTKLNPLVTTEGIATRSDGILPSRQPLHPNHSTKHSRRLVKHRWRVLPLVLAPYKSPQEGIYYN